MISDVAPEMTAIAAARAARAGLDNVSTRELDLERIDEPDGSYDVVLCREGLMLVPDPARAAREIGASCARAAAWRSRSGGRASATRGSASCSTPSAPRSARRCRRPASPGPSRSRTPAGWRALLSDAGLADVAVGEQAAPLRAPSFEEWWTRTSALAGPLAKLLAALPEEAAAQIRANAREASARYETADGLEFPGLTLVASGRNP